MLARVVCCTLWTRVTNPRVGSSQRREYYVRNVRYEGLLVFHYMLGVIAWAVTFSFLAFILAFFAEGRGMHLMRVVLGLAPRKQGLEAFETVPRDEGDWRVIAPLEEPQPGFRALSSGTDSDLTASHRSGAPV